MIISTPPTHIYMCPVAWSFWPCPAAGMLGLLDDLLRQRLLRGTVETEVTGESSPLVTSLASPLLGQQKRQAPTDGVEEWVIK